MTAIGWNSIVIEWNDQTHRFELVVPLYLPQESNIVVFISHGHEYRLSMKILI